MGLRCRRSNSGYVQEKIAARGLTERAKVELCDYTAVQGAFDKIAVLEMSEHVGYKNHPRYYQTVHRLLQPDGLFLHHAITRPAKRDERIFRKRRAELALLTRYVLPGGEFDHIGMTLTNLERFGFEVHDVEGWREHYPRTCRLWHDRLLVNRKAAEREVGPVTVRLFLLYLAGCSIAFERSTLSSTKFSRQNAAEVHRAYHQRAQTCIGGRRPRQPVVSWRATTKS